MYPLGGVTTVSNCFTGENEAFSSDVTQAINVEVRTQSTQSIVNGFFSLR